MSWNYRIMKRNSENSDEDTMNEWFEIHEVYYDSNGKIEGYTQNAISPGGYNLDELKLDLNLILKSLEKPILDYKEDD